MASLIATPTKKITKKAFEADLIQRHGFDDLTVSPYQEEIDRDDWGKPIFTKLSLYYVNDVHVGTWQKGEGWRFELDGEL